ncbi:MAG: bifunctional riboflavin kinase/FAD synthetase [Rhodospirillales bacterium]|nr:bifunctional riboflavin kinase/FAD synthetase [Rhodospirillales bacterium]
MRLFRHYSELPADALGAVVAIGNFDGVHRGHQAVIGAAQGMARTAGLPVAVMSFEPHPRLFFKPESEPFRLTPLRIKARLIEAIGVDQMFVLHFDAAFAALSAAEFVRKVLVEGVKAHHVVVGYDFTFGRARGGNVPLLQAMGTELGFAVTSVQPVSHEAGPYSSTAVRACLMSERPAAAAALLGHYWEIEGRVEGGDRRGRQLGFPTANIRLGEFLHPSPGGYVVRAGIDKGGATVWHDGVANFGRRPTFDKKDLILEVHLFDFAGDLYGKHLRVQLIEFLRPEEKFESLDALKAAIVEDCARAKRILAECPPAVPPAVFSAQAKKRAHS